MRMTMKLDWLGGGAVNWRNALRLMAAMAVL
jgi:hypothetical protein